MKRFATRINLLLAFGLIALVTLCYLGFDYYIKSTGRAIVTAWLETEAMELQQGNFLSAVAKSQRIILSSDLIKGVQLDKFEKGDPVNLIQIGEKVVSYSKNCHVNGIALSKIGLFSYHLEYCFEQSGLVRVIFYVYSWNLNAAFFAITFLLTGLFAAFIFLLIHLQAYEANSKLQILEAFNDIAKQVAHDIRSPVAAISMVSSRIRSDAKEYDIISRASLRIERIASDLLLRSGELAISEPSHVIRYPLAPLLEEIIHEKNAFHTAKLHLDVSAASEIYVCLDKKEFMRSLSNLIENGFDAIRGMPDGSVTLAVRCYNDHPQILIADNGVGIPESVVSVLGKKGFSYKKPKGSGLGLFHAKKFFEGNGGSLDIQSKEGRGTVIAIKVPGFKSRIGDVAK